MKKSFIALALAGLSFVSINTLAAESDQEIIVTASRTAQTADDALASVSVITRQDIERSQAKSVAELLTGLAGIDSAVSGGYGKATSFYLRGTNDGHVLVLIDGVRVGSATLGTTQFEFLPVAEIERIEIVRGPASSLYGSDAIGGVIQIFTRRGNKPWLAEAQAGLGTYSTGSAGAGVSGASGGTRYSVHATRFRTVGFDAQQNLAPTPFGPTQNQPDDDGYDNTGASLYLGHRFTNGASLETSLIGSGGETEYDGFYARSRFGQQAWNAKGELYPLERWRTQLTVGTNLDTAKNYYADNTLGSRITTRRATTAWQNDVTLTERQLLTLGADYLVEEISGTVAYTDTRRENGAAFLQYRGDAGPVSLQISGRHDRNSSFGDYNTEQIALGYRVHRTLRFNASYGTAFKAPTFNALFWPTETTSWGGLTYITLGNPGIQPEESRSTEVGLTFAPSRQSELRVSAFQTDIKNLISWVATQTGPTEFTTRPENVTHAHIDGLELCMRAGYAGWVTGVTYTWVDPRDEATDRLLQRRAQNTFRADLERTLGALRLGMGWLAQSERFDYYDTTAVRLAGYGVLNVHAQYDFTPSWWLRARLDNALDREYETADTYNSTGRSLFVTLGFQGS